MLLKQTKIVASISDRRCDVDFIKQLFEAGMNVVRMNTAHASREGFEALIANVRAVSNRIAILMDTKGPEVRTTANAEPIPYKIGEKVKIVGNPDLETTRELPAPAAMVAAGGRSGRSDEAIGIGNGPVSVPVQAHIKE